MVIPEFSACQGGMCMPRLLLNFSNFINTAVDAASGADHLGL